MADWIGVDMAEATTCPVCHEGTIPRGARTCSRSCGQRLRATAAGRKLLKGRTCEVCGDTYDATYGEQRTCGRDCGKTIQQFRGAESSRKRSEALREMTGWPSCKIYVIDCAECGTPFTARNKRARLCGPQCRTAFNRREQIAYVTRRYRQEPAFRDRINARAQARRAERLGLGNQQITLTYLIERDHARCGICHKPVRAKSGPMRPSVDHVIPLSRGGSHDLANVQLAHYRCNLSKNNRGGGEQLALVG